MASLSAPLTGRVPEAAAGFIYGSSDREASPGGTEEVGEKRLAASLAFGSKKRRKQSKPVRIHALDAAENAGNPSETSAELACPHCPRLFQYRFDFHQHLLLDHGAQNGSTSEGGLGEASNGDAPLNLSNGHGRTEGISGHDAIRGSNGTMSANDFPTEQHFDQTEAEDYRTNHRMEPDYRSSRQPQAEEYGTGHQSEPEDYSTAGSSGSEDLRTQRGIDNSEMKPDARSAEGREPLTPRQHKFSPPSFLPYGSPPLLLPFLSQQLGGGPTHGSDAAKHSKQQCFCELCGKEFFDKHLLRAHKANKHGIIIAEDPRSPQMTISGRQHSPGGESRDSGRPSSESETQQLRPGTDTFCQICQKQFCNVHYLNKHRVTAHADQSGGEASGRQGQNDSGREHLDDRQGGGRDHAEATRQDKRDPYDPRQLSAPGVGVATPVSRSVLEEGRAMASAPGTPHQFTRDQLRLMGVTNVDAFCNICCKEFCNKYFLKVHKYKMHNIGSPPPERERDRDRDRSSVPEPPSCPPLERLLEAPIRESAFPQECDQCKRPFQSSYLLQMHKYYFHGLGQQFAGGLFPPGEAPPPVTKKSKSSRKKENFGEDLRKLQGMIKGLHDKRDECDGAEDAVTCHVCQRRLESKAVLQAHLVSDHGIPAAGQEELVIPRPQPPPVRPPGGTDDRSKKPAPAHTPTADTRCNICKKDLYAPFFLKQHMQAAHGIQPGSNLPGSPAGPVGTLSGMPASAAGAMSTGGGGRMLSASETDFLARIRREVESQRKPERPRPASTSRSYCEICKKELCNKYFMKTHMIKMHGINLETHQSQGGATCDVCQKELCGRYFLKVHKQNAHGVKDTEIEQDPRFREEISKDEDNLEICKTCTGKFKTAKLLEQHMVGEHGAPKEKKSKSSSSSSSAAAAAAAAASAQLPSIGPSCTLCAKTFPDLLTLRLHMLQTHPLPEPPRSAEDAASEDAKVSSFWMRDKLLRYPFGPFGAGFPPFLPAERMLSLFPRLGQAAAGASETGNASPFPFPPPGLMPAMPDSLQSAATATTTSGTADNRADTLPVESPANSEVRPSTSGSQRDSLAEQVVVSSTYNPSETQMPEHCASSSDQQLTTHRLFRCSACGLKFRRRQQFLQHWQEHHGRKPPITTGILSGYLKRRQRCHKCGFAARSRGTLLRHIRRHHRRSTSSPAGAESDRRSLYSLPLPAEDPQAYRMQPLVMSPQKGEQERMVPPVLTSLPTLKPLSEVTELTVRLMPV